MPHVFQFVPLERTDNSEVRRRLSRFQGLNPQAPLELRDGRIQRWNRGDGSKGLPMDRSKLPGERSEARHHSQI